MQVPEHPSAGTPASFGRRWIAAVVDYGILYGLTLAYIVYLGEPEATGSRLVTGLALLPPFIVWFALLPGLEAATGQTLGKSILGLVVRRADGRPPGTGACFKRHLADVVDSFFLGVPAYFVMRNTPRRQRIGDLWAGTVVEDQDGAPGAGGSKTGA